jgi:hypothetical protein
MTRAGRRLTGMDDERAAETLAAPRLIDREGT